MNTFGNIEFLKARRVSSNHRHIINRLQYFSNL